VETIRRRAAEGQPLRVVNDQRISPTSTRELSRRLIELVRTGAFGLYHAASSDTCTWYEFARAIVEHVGSSSPVTPVSSSEYAMAARRPAMSALGGVRLIAAGVPACGSWRRMLEAYLDHAPVSSGV
jgi:dTDP-4-dehydrorhamnose reductase